MMTASIWVFCCDPCGVRGRTVRHLLRWLRHRRLPFHVFDWNHLPPASAQPPELLFVSGSRYSWSKDDVPQELRSALRQVLRRSVEQRFSVCGICFGMQSMMALYGGLVAPSREGFVDRPDLIVPEEGFVPTPLMAHRYHGDVVQRVAPGFRVLARSRFGEVMAVRAGDPSKRWIGFQFHPEMREDTWFMLDRLWAEKTPN